MLTKSLVFLHFESKKLTLKTFYFRRRKVGAKRPRFSSETFIHGEREGRREARPRRWWWWCPMGDYSATIGRTSTASQNLSLIFLIQIFHTECISDFDFLWRFTFSCLPEIRTHVHGVRTWIVGLRRSRLDNGLLYAFRLYLLVKDAKWFFVSLLITFEVNKILDGTYVCKIKSS